MDISDYRRKLEKTLVSPDLMNEEKLQTLVRNQILQSSHDNLHFEGEIESVVKRRSKEVSNVLSMMRSASLTDIRSSKDSHTATWKVKQESDEFRVMYREEAEGSPFHSLLVEGYVDGPLDVCMCVSWETGLYSKWWPQTSIPAFKISSSRCLKRVRTGEQISLVRMKISWPLSSREAVLHYFAFEYLQDDLVVVLFNSISDSETIDRRSHGFTRDGIPNADEVIRVDVRGGFVCKRIAANRCYIRMIASLDVKLDMIPPSFINFICRNFLGSGFKFFKKEIASVSAGDKKFGEALKDPFYTRIRDGLSTHDPKRSAGTTFEDTVLNEVDELKCKEESIGCRALKSSKVAISREVEESLKILEKVNTIVRQRACRNSGVDLTNLDEKCVEESIILEGTRKRVEVSSVGEARIIYHASGVKESNSYTRDTNQGKIATNSSMNKKTTKGVNVSRLNKIIKSRFRCFFLK